MCMYRYRGRIFERNEKGSMVAIGGRVFLPMG